MVGRSGGWVTARCAKFHFRISYPENWVVENSSTPKFHEFRFQIYPEKGYSDAPKVDIEASDDDPTSPRKWAEHNARLFRNNKGTTVRGPTLVDFGGIEAYTNIVRLPEKGGGTYRSQSFYFRHRGILMIVSVNLKAKSKSGDSMTAVKVLRSFQVENR